MINAGDFFIGPYPPGSEKRRRILVLTPEDDGKVVVAFTSTSMTDTTVVLQPGDHREITERCCVVYEEAELTLVSIIVSALKQGALKKCAPLAPRILVKVQEGMFESEDVSIEIIEFAKDLI